MYQHEASDRARDIAYKVIASSLDLCREKKRVRRRSLPAARKVGSAHLVHGAVTVLELIEALRPREDTPNRVDPDAHELRVRLPEALRQSGEGPAGSGTGDDDVDRPGGWTLCRGRDSGERVEDLWGGGVVVRFRVCQAGKGTLSSAPAPGERFQSHQILTCEVVVLVKHDGARGRLDDPLRERDVRLGRVPRCLGRRPVDLGAC